MEALEKSNTNKDGGNVIMLTIGENLPDDANCNMKECKESNWQEVFEKIDKKLKEMPYRSQILIRTNYRSCSRGFASGNKYFLHITYEKVFYGEPGYETISIFKCYTNDLYESLLKAYEQLNLVYEKLSSELTPTKTQDIDIDG